MLVLAFLRRLIFAPLVGVLLVVSVLPIILFGALGAILIYKSNGNQIMAPAPLILFSVVFFFFVSTCAMTQMARYAGSFSGALRLAEQIPFFRAFWRVLWILILFAIANVVLGVVAGLLAVRFGVDLRFLTNARGLAGQNDAEAERALVEFLEGKWFLAYALFALLLSGLQALFLVPAACGMGERFALAWTGSYILLRLIVILPFLAIALYVVADVFAWIVDRFLPADPDSKATQTVFRQTFMIVLSISFAMAGEAAVLASCRQREHKRRPTQDFNEQNNHEAGEMLRAWMSDGR